MKAQCQRNRNLHGHEHMTVPFRNTPSYASMLVGTPAATTIAGADAPVKAAGTFVAGEASNDMSVAATNKITYDGATERAFKVDVAATLAAASGTNQELEVSVYKYDASAASGAIVANCKVSNLAPGTVGVAVATSCTVLLDTGDYVELHVANVTGAVNVTLEHGGMSMIGLPV